MVYKLGDMEFRIKKDAEKYVSSFLRNGIIQDKDKSWLMELFSRHSQQKNINNVKDINICSNIGGFNSFKLLYENGDEDFISYKECFKPINPDRTFRENKTIAFRDLIREQIYNFKCSCINLQCEICLSCDNPHIDHIYPFCKLVEEFISKNNFDDFTTIVNNNMRIFLNNEINEKWKEYHKENATYQILCSKCNIKKSNKV